MEDNDEFDVIVIGGGPAGENVAGRTADGGLRVAVVESELVGGECSYWGCIPSKALIRPGDVLAMARRVPGAAAAVNGTIDVAAVFARRNELTGDWNDHGALPWLEDKGIAVVRGVGRLGGERSVSVTGVDGAHRRLTARVAVVLATGTRPFVPPIDGLADAEPWDNRDATSTSTVPRRLLVLGGGAIGAELAQGFRRLGSVAVTVLEGGPRLLAREEPFAGEQVREAFEAEGITVVTGARVSSVRRGEAGEVVATVDDGRTFTGDEILVAVGRRPATDDLGLEGVGLEPGKPVRVDDHLRAVDVEGAWLYAVGDCNGRALLTHMAKYQARIAADVILGKEARDEASADVVPRVTFTDPQVAAVGLTEAQARERGLAVRIVSFGTADVGGSSVEGVGLGGTSQLVIDENRHLIVGATFTGQDTQELLHSATIAIIGQVPLQRLWHAVPSFPTVSEVWLRLLEQYGL